MFGSPPLVQTFDHTEWRLPSPLPSRENLVQKQGSKIDPRPFPRLHLGGPLSVRVKTSRDQRPKKGTGTSQTQELHVWQGCSENTGRFVSGAIFEIGRGLGLEFFSLSFRRNVLGFSGPPLRG